MSRLHDPISFGSRITARGTISGLRKLFLNLRFGHERTALRVASAPVPAVVGTAKKGSGGLTIGTPRPTPSNRSTIISSAISSESGFTFVARADNAFPKSIVAPPPTATTTTFFWSPGIVHIAFATCCTVGSPQE